MITIAGYLVHHSGFTTSGKFSEEDALQKHMSHMGEWLNLNNLNDEFEIELELIFL